MIRSTGRSWAPAGIEPTIMHNSQMAEQQIQRFNIGGTLSPRVAAAKKRRFLAAGSRAFVLLLLYRHELLDAAAGDRFGNIDAAFGINGDRVAVGEVASVVPGTRDDPADAESAEHCRGCLVQQPDVIVVQIDIDDSILAGRALGREIADIGPEIDVAGSRRGGTQNGGGVFRGVGSGPIDTVGKAGRRGLTGIAADVDDPHRGAQRLRHEGRRWGTATSGEHLNSAVGPIAGIDIPVIAEDDTMRVAAAGRPESPGRTRLAVACHAVDHTRLAPLAIVLVGPTSVGSRVDDDAVV